MKPTFNRNSAPRLTLRRGLLVLAGLILIVLVGLYLAATVFPALGAQGSDALRSVIGDQAVAQLETWIFQVQDSIHQTEYSLGLNKPASPWQDPNTATAAPTTLPSDTPTLEQSPTPLPQATPEPSATPKPTLKPSSTPWRPAPAHALGSLEGEGAWQAYIKDSKGSPLAYRTFIQPDPKRPYSLVAVVAFDLTRTRLGFVLGWEEPSVKGGPKGTGLIPTTDALPGNLLATFNGAFKSEHGAYGAMSDGIVALPARKGFATVVIYTDGSVKIGEYGKDLLSLDNALAWRQNCSLVIQNGQINPLVNDDSAEFWGANLHGETVTWRSGLGISADGKTLYYFAGPNLMISVLAAAMQAVNVEAGMQLDINNYWVHFTAIRDTAGQNVPDPLFPDEMKADVGRYLTKYARDFFYVSVK
jgi:hypothetical protein